MTYTSTRAAPFTSPGTRLEMLFGEALKQARDKAGMTQAELAKRADVPLRTIQGWEQGRRSPVSPDFFKLVKALNVSADVFATVAEGVTAPPKPRARKSKGK